MNRFKPINKEQVELTGKELETGESIEEKVRRAMTTGAPIEAISPMLYTERKEGVKPEYDIRADKFEIAQKAMTTIAEGSRTKRQERIKGVDKPAASSE